MKKPRPTLRERFQKYQSCGPFAGLIMLVVVVFDLIFFMLLSWWTPKEEIDIAIDFPHKKYLESREKYGDHSFLIPERKRDWISRGD